MYEKSNNDKIVFYAYETLINFRERETHMIPLK